MDNTSLSYLTRIRRALHSIAELSGEEVKTSEFIVNELRLLGYKPKTIGTGVFCDVGKGTPRLAFRADIDALPITENTAVTGVDFASPGNTMHACGHDGHTANLLNVARILGGKSNVPLRLIFQFGEEGIGGSATMIENGVLDGVDEIYALHLCPELEEGKVGYCYGGMFAGTIEFDVCSKGKAAHCAMPDKGNDAIKASIAVANEAFAAAKENGLIINLGKVCGGHARNIISDGCSAEYSLRFYDMEKAEAVIMRIQRAALAADDGFGTDTAITTRSVYPPVINHALAVDKVRSIMGDDAVETEPRFTAEDFSNYLLKVPGCMVWLGIKTDKHSSPLHSDTFSFDERALITGTQLFLKLIDAR